ncbi:malonate--CoA ligase ACSF3, mitochondrial-like [Ornithodoros turicata]|uniref:malonate--CoA ligase ACSF3, mitochondrial-like n=1 Tax=Ornithodoros turicata TaxID=34597 RepID=UPI00313A04D6
MLKVIPKITLLPWSPLARNAHRKLTSFPPPFESLFNQCIAHKDRTAIIDVHGSHSYANILARSASLKKKLDPFLKEKSQQRIAFLCPNDSRYVAAQWACWLGENVAVPLYREHPRPVLEYYIKDSQSSVLVTTEEYADRLQPISKDLDLPIVVTDLESAVLEDIMPITKQVLEDWKRMKKKNAQILYTSGTTGPPKGVVTTHHNIYVQSAALLSSWEYRPSDVILHTLPLHHTHGIINALVAPLYAGSIIVMLPKFDAADVWNYLLEPPAGVPRPNVYMAVPTIYARLIEHYNKLFTGSGPYSRSKEFIRATCAQKIRLMISGSAALPLPVLEQWKEITGHTLLERYGMTEIGMALGNPLHGKRKPGFVGKPFPGVEVSIVKQNAYSNKGYDVIASGDHHKTTVMQNHENECGELLVKGPNVFKEYWNRLDATEEAFTSDGWFKTGDTAQFTDGDYRILGRTSSDIIKSGGYKISALDVERHLLAHPNIRDCAVVGVPDLTWGEKVACVVALHDPKRTLTLQCLREWGKHEMDAAMMPAVLKVMDDIPRNAMGKVNKKDIAAQFSCQAR